jgi:hypothetical protein
MIRRSALRYFGGFDESPRLRGAADYDLWVRIAAGGHSIGRLDESFARLAPPTEPRAKHRRRRTLKQGTALRRFRKLHPDIPSRQKKLLRSCLARTSRSLGRICLMERHRRRSRRYLRNSIQVCPVQIRSYLLLALSFFDPAVSIRILRPFVPAD